MEQKLNEIYNIKTAILRELKFKGYSETEIGTLLKDIPKLIEKLRVDSINGDVPQWFKDSVVCWYNPARLGLTNEEIKTNRGQFLLQDFSGNGLDMTMYNFAGNGLSGMDCYVFPTFYKWIDKTEGEVTIIDDYKIIWNRVNIPSYKFTYTLYNDSPFKVRSSKNFQVLLQIFYKLPDDTMKYKTHIVDIVENTDTIINIPSGTELGLEGTFSSNKVVFNTASNVKTEIEILPLYKNALVFDGVDDFGVSRNLPILNDYTVITKREIFKIANSCVASKRILRDGAFIFERSLQNIKDVVSYGWSNAVKDFSSSNISIQSKYLYNNTIIKKGDWTDVNVLYLAQITDKSYKSAFALYQFLLFNRTLTQEELEYIKYVIMGEPLPEPIAVYSAKNRSNNESADTINILPNLAPNNNRDYDVALKNFNFDALGNWGGYNFQKLQMGRIYVAKALIDIMDFNILRIRQIKTTSSLYGIYNLGKLAANSVINCIIKVSNLPDNIILCIGTHNLYSQQLKNGINFVNVIYATEAVASFYIANQYIGNCNIVIEILPQYKNALIFDSVDDYGICEKFPGFSRDKGYTIIAKRKNLGTNYTTNAVLLNKGAFTFEDFYNNKSASFGESSIINIPEEISWLNSKSYNNLLLYKGDKADNSTLLLGSETNNSGFWKGALSELHIFDRDLSETEIKWYIKRNIQTEFDIPLIDLISYGIQWDTRTPDSTITRIGNPLLHKELPIQSSYKGCVAKGNKIQYYLDPNDWSKKADGTPSVLNGTDGDVKVHIMKFYGKSFEDGTLRSVRISTTKVDDTWMEIPEMLIDAYRCTINNVEGKTASVVSNDIKYRGGGNRSANDLFLATEPTKSDLGKPRTAMSRANMRNYAKKAGAELLCYEFYKWIFYWNYVIEYANFNSQANYNKALTPEGYYQGGLGMGVTTMGNWGSYNGLYPLTPCGYCNEFGNGTGVKDIVIPEFTFTEKDVLKTQPRQVLHVARWRGFDNPFGDIWTNLDGFVAKRNAANEPSNIYTTTDATCFDDSITNKTVAGIEIPLDGYIKDFALGSRGDIIPSVIGGNSSQWMCDCHYCKPTYTGLRTLLVGGGADGWSYAGFGYFYSNHGVGYVYATVGFRTLIRL